MSFFIFCLSYTLIWIIYWVNIMIYTWGKYNLYWQLFRCHSLASLPKLVWSRLHQWCEDVKCGAASLPGRPALKTHRLVGWGFACKWGSGVGTQLESTCIIIHRKSSMVLSQTPSPALVNNSQHSTQLCTQHWFAGQIPRSQLQLWWTVRSKSDV